ELQAVVLLPQLEKLDNRNARRLEQVRRLRRLLDGVPGLRLFTAEEPEGVPAFYKVGFQYDEEVFGLPRERFTAALRAEGVAVDEGFRALHVGRSPSRYPAGGAVAAAREGQPWRV